MDDDMDVGRSHDAPRRKKAVRKKRSTRKVSAPSVVESAHKGAIVFRTLKLRNRSGTVLFVPILNEDGTSTQRRLGAQAELSVQEDRITSYAQRLIDLGRIAIAR